MKTQAWRPAAVSTPDTRKEGLYLDELVHFYETETRATSEVPAAAAFIMAIEFVSRGFPFEIREVESQEVVLSSNGRRLEGSHGMMQAMTDSAVMLDGIVKRHLRDFAEQVQSSIREGMQEARAKALAAPARKAETEVPTAAGAPEQAVASEVKDAEARVDAESVNQETPGAA